MDAYKVLGLTEGATEEEIKTAYRALAQKYNPDNYEAGPLREEAEAKMTELNEAFDALMGAIRTGTDVFKALALGADAVLIGRPFVPMVYGDGAQGVATYIEKIGSELRDTMAMCGVHTLGEITRDCVRVM